MHYQIGVLRGVIYLYGNLLITILWLYLTMKVASAPVVTNLGNNLSFNCVLLVKMKQATSQSSTTDQLLLIMHLLFVQQNDIKSSPDILILEQFNLYVCVPWAQ